MTIDLDPVGHRARAWHRPAKPLAAPLALALACLAPTVAPAVPYDLGRHEAAPPGPVNTWWIEGPQGELMVVDGQRTAEEASAAIEAIRAMGLPVAALVLTHPHPDHFTGLGLMAEAFPDAQVVMAVGTVGELEADTQGLIGAAFEAEDAPRPPEPDVVVADGDRLTLAGMDVMVHTLGAGESVEALVLRLPQAGLAVTGDVATEGLVPFYAEARSAAWLGQLDRLEALLPEGTRILPGHGQDGEVSEIAAWTRDYTEALRAEVRAAIAEDSPEGATVTADERSAIRGAVEATYPAELGVAGMPLDDLWALNVEAVARELSGEDAGFQPPTE